MKTYRQLLESIDFRFNKKNTDITEVLDALEVIDESEIYEYIDSLDESTFQALNSYLNEVAKGHTIEAHGVKGAKNTKWRKSFRDHDHLGDWVEKNDAEVHGVRELENHNQKNKNLGESEQLSELSKKTLGSYIKKASHDVATRGAATRQFSIDARKAREDHDYTGSRKKEAQADKTFAKSWKRREGMAKAVDRLTKEDINESAVGIYTNFITEHKGN